MAKLDNRFLNVVLRNLPYDEEGTTLETVLGSITAGSGDASYGCWLTYTSARTVTVNQGSLDIFGVNHPVAATVVDIYNDFGDAGSPLVNTTYFLYAADENGVLNFYFSASVPTRPGYSDTSLDILRRNLPLRHPAHANWRYIGQVLFRADATILPFSACSPTYWEGAWMSATRNVDMTLAHAWGAVPQEVSFRFSTTATNSANTLTTVAYADPASKLYGAQPRTVSDKSLYLDIQKDALFWDNNTAAWVNSGYIKLVVTR